MTSPTLTRRRPVRVATCLALLLTAAACGSDDDGDTGAPEGSTTSTEAPATGDEYGDTGDTGGSAEAGTIVAEDFSLTDLTVAPGEEIVLRNDGEAPHTATADDDSFDTGQVTAGETSAPVTAPDEPGTYAFHCEIHNAMTATLTVEE
jgi:plastocyanin